MDSYQPVEKEARAVAFTAWVLQEREDCPPVRRVGAHPAQVPGGATRLHGAGVRPVAGVGRTTARGPLLDPGPAQGQGGFALGGPLPQGGHEEPVRVEGPAASGRRRRLRHQRAAGGSGRSAGVDAEAGLEVPRAEAGERRLGGLHAAPESAAGVAAEQGADPGSAGRAVQALRGARGAGNL